MIMKKGCLLFLALLTLASCSGSGTSGKNTGVIECQNLNIYGNNTYNYSEEIMRVCEFKSANNDKIYTSYAEAGSVINLYQDRYSVDYVSYNYSGFIGFITMEQHIYLDLDKRIVDLQTNYVECKYQNLEEKSGGDPYDNPKAYQCAKSGYYIIYFNFNAPTVVRKSLEDTSLERHTYIQIGDSSVVAYTPKLS